DWGPRVRGIVDVAEVAVGPRQMLVIPFELAGLDVERQRRIAVEVGGRGPRRAFGAAVPLEPGIGFGIGDRPVERLALRIVRAGQAPAAGDPALEREVAPAVAARFAGRRGVVELPDFLAGLRVVRRDEAAGACLAGAAADHLALDHDRSRGV